MLQILIVEDEPLLAATLKHLVELNPRYVVTAVSNDLQSAMDAVREKRPDLALVDLQLANATSGFSVAARLHEMDVPCLFTTGKAPAFPLPDLAIGCLEKPFEYEDLVRTLRMAEDILKGRENFVLRPKLPDQLQIYSAASEPPSDPAWVPTVRPHRNSLKSRISHWFATS